MRYAALILFLFTVSCSRQPAANAVKASSPSKQEAVEVDVATAQLRSLDRSILLTGALLPDETVTIAAEVPGRVLRMPADFGQTVRMGDILAELDKTELQLQYERSRAALNQALARLGLDPAQANEQPATTPAVRQAAAQLEDARFKFESAQKLVAGGDISRERFNEAEKTFRARQAALDGARDEMRTLWANAETLKTEVRLAEKRLKDAVIRAPFEGEVSERRAAPGQYVKDNVPLLTLVKAYPLRLRLEAPEPAAAAVKPGTPLEFTTEAVAGKTFSAVVRELNPALNEQSRSLVAEARLTSSDPRLRPGMFVQIRLILDRGAQAVVVPRNAVYTVAGLTKLFLVRNSRLTECRFTPGQALENWIEVPSGLVKPGEQVAVGNLAPLVDGQNVRVRRKG
jgi:membrane fusion protein (multidrug efflux system)